MRYCKEGWPNNNNQRDSKGSSMSSFKQLKDSLSCESGCLFYGSRLVIPLKLQSSVLQILHQGHFGMRRMKQLSRTAVYWPGLDAQIMDMCLSCHACMEHQNNPPQAPIHPWMMPEKCWSRVHIDHARGWCWLTLTRVPNSPCHFINVKQSYYSTSGGRFCTFRFSTYDCE